MEPSMKLSNNSMNDKIKFMTKWLLKPGQIDPETRGGLKILDVTIYQNHELMRYLSSYKRHRP